MNVLARVILAKTFFTKHRNLFNTSFTKSEHTIKKDVVLPSIVSTVNTRNAWGQEPPFGDQERLAFYNSGFPVEAE